MAGAPKVSVILSTWNRGRHILPTLHSVLRQSFRDFDLHIIGDGCDDDTEHVLKPYLSQRVRWFNLSRRQGNQAFPNNVGIARSRGRYIAYQGHEDLWAGTISSGSSRFSTAIPPATWP